MANLQIARQWHPSLHARGGFIRVVVLDIFWYFHPENWGGFPFWLIFFRGVGSTTNQLYVFWGKATWLTKRLFKLKKNRWFVLLVGFMAGHCSWWYIIGLKLGSTKTHGGCDFDTFGLPRWSQLSIMEGWCLAGHRRLSKKLTKQEVGFPHLKTNLAMEK